MQADLPADPFALAPLPAPQVAARRTLALCGGTVELAWLPLRAQRLGIPRADRPPLRPPLAEEILAKEALWRGGGVVLTPNRYPFAARQVLLWDEAPQREAGENLLRAALLLEERTGGTVQLNTVGAAASLPRAHVHLIGEVLPFLAAFRGEPCRAAWLPALPGVDVLELAPPFPVLGLGVRGPAPARAAALARLLELRGTPAANVVSAAGTSWWFPRSPVEIPAPHFPHALGASELAGRWCYTDERVFAAATAGDLEAALRAACLAR